MWHIMTYHSIPYHVTCTHLTACEHDGWRSHTSSLGRQFITSAQHVMSCHIVTVVVLLELAHVDVWWHSDCVWWLSLQSNGCNNSQGLGHENATRTYMDNYFLTHLLSRSSHVSSVSAISTLSTAGNAAASTDVITEAIASHMPHDLCDHDS